MKRIVSVLAAGLWLFGQSADDPDARAAFQEIYSRIDRAVAAKDQETVNRLFPAETQIHIGPHNLSLRGAIASEMAQPGLSRRSEVKTARVEGTTATVTVDVIHVLASGGGKKEDRVTVRETWERTDAGWVCRASERIGGEPAIRPTSGEEAKPVIAEIRSRAVKLATVEPGVAFDDLEAFGKAVGDARIVGLGEATHGTREFFRIKQRLIQYLVRRKGFTVVAFETNWPDAAEIDRRIKAGDGPRMEVALADLMEWMRSEYRAGARLTWTGFDMQAVGSAADLALGYLWRRAPEAAPPAEAVYAEARKIDADHTNFFLPGAAEAARRADAIVAQFDERRTEWTEKSSAAEWRDARHAAATVAAAAAMRVAANGGGYRDRMMAKNVEWLADEAFPGEKIILWAHSDHVMGAPDKMGGWLRKRFGDTYYVVGTAFRRGEIWAYGMDGNQNKGFGAWPVAPAPEGSGDAVLSAARIPLFFLDLRSVPRDSSLGLWLAAEHRFNFAGGVLPIGKESMWPGSLRASYDGLVFVEESHANVPAR